MHWKHDIEFIGGPIDGLSVSRGVPLATFVCVPTNVTRRGGFWSAVVRVFRAGGRTRTCMAMYERIEEAGTCRYLYLGSQLFAPEDLASRTGVSHHALEWLES